MIEGRVAYETVDHTADLGVVVAGRSAADLFERCASAMFDLMVDVDAVRPTSACRVRVEAHGLEELLVAWLAELLGRAMEEGKVYGRFEISDLRRDGADWILESEIRGEPLDVERHAFETELKAVTYHALRIEESEAGLEATVLFDV